MSQATTTSAEILRHIAMDNETAIEHAMILADKTILAAEGLMIYSGNHPEHGAIHIVVPMAGMSHLLLPFAVRHL